MASLQAFLPVAGSAVWRKDRRRHSSLSDSDHGTIMIKHIVIREVWQKKLPSPHAVYKIDVMTQSSHWFVLRRYKEFRELHTKLVKTYGIAKDMIPPKKLSSNMSLNHLQKRREALEHYLQRLINGSQEVAKSQEMFDFLQVKTNDVQYVTRHLAKHLAVVGDSILSNGGSMALTPTQLHCITKQLVLPYNTEDDEEQDKLVDLGHLYSFIYQLEHLVINNQMTTDVYQDLLNHLKFDVSLFKNIRTLQISGCPIDIIDNMSVIQHQITHLTAHKCLKSLKEILVECVTAKKTAPKTSRTDVEHWRTNSTSKLVVSHVIVQPWISLTDINFSHNTIMQLDNSLKLLPLLRKLDLSHNDIGHLDLQTLYCPTLTHVNLSHNSISYITATAKDLSHIKSLVLNHNQLQALEGMDCLSGVVELDLSHNEICSGNEASKLGALYKLKYLYLAGNGVASQRLLILSYFKGREIVLDGKLVSAEEKDKLEGSRSPSSSVSSLPRQRERTPTIVSDDLETWCDTDESDNDSGISGNFSQHRLAADSVSSNCNRGGRPFVSGSTSSQLSLNNSSARKGTNPFSEEYSETPSTELNFQWSYYDGFDNGGNRNSASNEEAEPLQSNIDVTELNNQAGVLKPEITDEVVLNPLSKDVTESPFSFNGSSTPEPNVSSMNSAEESIDLSRISHKPSYISNDICTTEPNISTIYSTEENLNPSGITDELVSPSSGFSVSSKEAEPSHDNSAIHSPEPNISTMYSTEENLDRSGITDELVVPSSDQSSELLDLISSNENDLHSHQKETSEKCLKRYDPGVPTLDNLETPHQGASTSDTDHVPILNRDVLHSEISDSEMVSATTDDCFGLLDSFGNKMVDSETPLQGASTSDTEHFPIWDKDVPHSEISDSEMVSATTDDCVGLLDSFGTKDDDSETPLQGTQIPGAAPIPTWDEDELHSGISDIEKTLVASPEFSGLSDSGIINIPENSPQVGFISDEKPILACDKDTLYSEIIDNSAHLTDGAETPPRSGDHTSNTKHIPTSDEDASHSEISDNEKASCECVGLYDSSVNNVDDPNIFGKSLSCTQVISMWDNSTSNSEN